MIFDDPSHTFTRHFNRVTVFVLRIQFMGHAAHKRGLHMGAGMLLPEEMPARPHISDRFHRKRVFINFHALEVGTGTLIQIIIQNDLFGE